MFTPNRSRISGLSGSRRSTPRVSGTRNTRNSRFQRSYNTRSSLNITNTSFLSSPTVTSAFTSSNHTIESYETSIPVLVTEAISLADDISDISITIGENGWSLLVSGLKIFVWSHHHAGVSKIPTCKELSLRAVERDDYYTADLAVVYCNVDTEAVSVLASSKHGQLIFWPNILVSTATSCETKLSLSGIQCFKMVSVDRYGFLLCTTNSMIYHIFSTQSSIACKPISKWEGTLSKIGRRVSSFFFSPSSSDDNVIQMVVRKEKHEGDFSLLMATRNGIQYWRCAFRNEKEAETAQLICERELNEVLASKICVEAYGSIKSRFKVWAMDVKFVTRRGHIALLLAGSESVDMTSRVHYALVLAEDLSNLEHVNVFMFQHSETFSVTTESENYPYRLAIEDPSSLTLDHYAMWCRSRALLKSFASVDGDYVEDNINFSESGDKVLGVGNCAGRLILFSLTCGLITSSSNFERRLPAMLGESALEASFMSQSASNVSLPVTPSVSQTRMDQLESSENATQRLQAAFLHYCKLNLDQALSIIAEVFPLSGASDLLDSAVATLSADLLDDYPAQDPRWAESIPDSQELNAETAGSFILLHQLEDKLKAHTLYLKFLTEVGISARLFLVRGSRDKVVTKWLLWEHTEKLFASISLLQKHSAHQGLVDAAIRQALSHRENVSSKAGLTPRDFFYREVTRIDEIFECLLEEEEAAFMKGSLTSRERITKIAGVNSIFEAMLHSVRQYRKNQNLSYSDLDGNFYEYKPWTVGSGRQSIRKIILQQLKLTLERGLPEAEDGQQRALLCQSYYALTDILLEGYKEQIASLSLTDKTQDKKNEVKAAYVNHRNTVITGLVTVGQREKATSLAEKFLDFDVLIKICDQNNESEKLKNYMNKFSPEGFLEFLFRWYLERKEYRKLLECCGKSHQSELKSFLQAHPHLAWMEQLKTGDHMGAHLTLRQLAEMEKKSVEKKKAYLSLSKLSAAFSGSQKSLVEAQIEAINHEQLLIKYQESLPTCITDSLQQEEDMPVCSPKQLIQHFIGDDNENASESDFKKAFELLSYLPDVVDDDDDEAEDKEEWKLRIWCQLILKNSWSDIDSMLDPKDSCSHTTLLKTAILCAQSGLLADILPDANSLLKRSELARISGDASFSYLMKASFEWMRRSIESSPI